MSSLLRRRSMKEVKGEFAEVAVRVRTVAGVGLKKSGTVIRQSETDEAL